MMTNSIFGVEPVDLNSEFRSKHEYPYSYSAYFLWKGAKAEGDETVYSDRMRDWDAEKFREALSKVKKRLSQLNQKEMSKFLSVYFDKKIEATALAEGCNVSNGYPYWILWFKEIKDV